MYPLLILSVATITAALPWLVQQFTKHFNRLQYHRAVWWLPMLAALLFLIAFYLPDIHISTETTTFQQHFVGGGIYTACLFVYVSQLFGWRYGWPVTLGLLFAWTSAFGVANELLEFTLTKLNLAQIGTGDTDWDLLANTLGSAMGYFLLRLLTRAR